MIQPVLNQLSELSPRLAARAVRPVAFDHDEVAGLETGQIGVHVLGGRRHDVGGLQRRDDLPNDKDDEYQVEPAPIERL